MTVDNFLKIRSKDPNSKSDRYFLASTEDGQNAIKIGWGHSFQQFSTSLKNLEYNGQTNLGNALRLSFDLLNLFRIQENTDNFGQGMYPCYLDQSCIFVLTNENSTGSVRQFQTFLGPFLSFSYLFFFNS